MSGIKNELKRIKKDIENYINKDEDEKELIIFKEKMEILSFYSTVEIANLGINACCIYGLNK